MKANAGNFELNRISSLNPEDLDTLTVEQDSILQTLRQRLHDFNLGKVPMLVWDTKTCALVSRYSELKMDLEVRGMA